METQTLPPPPEVVYLDPLDTFLKDVRNLLFPHNPNGDHFIVDGVSYHDNGDISKPPYAMMCKVIMRPKDVAIQAYHKVKETYMDKLEAIATYYSEAVPTSTGKFYSGYTLAFVIKYHAPKH